MKWLVATTALGRLTLLYSSKYFTITFFVISITFQVSAKEVEVSKFMSSKSQLKWCILI